MTRPTATTGPDPVRGNQPGERGGPPRCVEVGTTYGPARVLIEEPARAPSFLLALTHGAGGDGDAPDLLAVRDAALWLGGVVARITQPYRVRGARAPGSAARQDAAWAEIITAIRGGQPAGPAGPLSSGRDALLPPERGGPLPLVQGGRSNGARVACRTAGTVNALAVIALAFPLRPPGHPDRSRAAELRMPGRKLLIVNGDRDPFGVPGRRPGARVVVLAGESHALSRHPAAVRRAVTAWLPRALGLPPVPGLLPAQGWRGQNLGSGHVPGRFRARKSARPAGDETP